MMDNAPVPLPLIKSKIRIPRRQPTLLRRERLIDFIHENIDHKLILVSAGAGYGKTSLLVDYAHDTELPLCWYSLDHNDTHILTFVEYLVAAIHERFPQFGGAVLQALRHYQGQPEAVEPFIRLLINEIEEKIEQYFVLVLDDYHTVSESATVNALIDGLLLWLPAHCHIILASRGIPRRITLTRLAAKMEVKGLGVEHLRFTANEIHDLLHLLGRTDTTREQARQLAERSEGWITGVLLAAQTSLAGAAQETLRLSISSGGVFDFMAAEVLELQPEEMQRFLLGSALLNEMTAPLCDALLGVTDSAQTLRELTEANLFTTALDAASSLYQYHQLFREFLVAKFERDDPEGYRRLCVKKAELMVHQGQRTWAIEGYLAAEAYDQAADAIEIVAQEAYVAGQHEALRGWLDALPPPVLDQHPRLLLYRGMVSTEVGELTNALEILNRAHRSYLARNDPAGAARALVQQAVAQRLRSRTTEAHALLQQALTLAGNDSLTTTLAHLNISILYSMQGQYDEGHREMALALELAERNGDDTNAAYAVTDLGNIELNRGQLASARQYYHRALLYWRKIGNPSSLSAALQGLGLVHQYLGQYAEAENRFEEALNNARQMADSRLEAYALANKADLLRDIGRYDEALEVCQQASRIASGAQATVLMIYVRITMGDVYRLRAALAHGKAAANSAENEAERRATDDEHLAQQLLVEALDQLNPTEMRQEAGLGHLALGALRLAGQDPSEARPHLEQALALLSEIEAPRDLARTHLYLAELARQQARPHEMLAHLERVAALADTLGSRQFIVAQGPSLLPLLEAAQEQRLVGLDAVRTRTEIGRLFPSITLPQALRIVQAAPPIEFLALKGGQVLRHGQPISDWESDSARVMAFLFVTYPQGLTRDRIKEMLWPDVSPAKGNSRYYSTMHRVRQMLDKEAIQRSDNLYHINPEMPYRYDMVEFERLYALGQGRNGSAHMARARAISLFRGEFMESCDHEWCSQIRESLNIKLGALLLAEARYMAQEGSMPEAESLYLRLLGLDPYDERAHRGIMWCRARRNDRNGALRQYLECERLLAHELDVEPSTETDDLRAAVLAGSVPATPPE
jgi:ATP/maltotriose-dependent transcriptional regulator MalT/DNA-binding SARP family transcriptional activator